MEEIYRFGHWITQELNPGVGEGMADPALTSLRTQLKNGIILVGEHVFRSVALSGNPEIAILNLCIRQDLLVDYSNQLWQYAHHGTSAHPFYGLWQQGMRSLEETIASLHILYPAGQHRYLRIPDFAAAQVAPAFKNLRKRLINSLRMAPVSPQWEYLMGDYFLPLCKGTGHLLSFHQVAYGQKLGRALENMLHADGPETETTLIQELVYLNFNHYPIQRFLKQQITDMAIGDDAEKKLRYYRLQLEHQEESRKYYYAADRNSLRECLIARINFELSHLDLNSPPLTQKVKATVSAPQLSILVQLWIDLGIFPKEYTKKQVMEALASVINTRGQKEELSVKSLLNHSKDPSQHTLEGVYYLLLAMILRLFKEYPDLLDNLKTSEKQAWKTLMSGI
ncbi:hypothetical protein SAMN05216436_107126 [bacterium A37T11]|nr:hypothetical protein SAMN05216436_107126 [bacterium A37T11]